MRAELEREYVAYVEAGSEALRRLAYRLCGDWPAAEDLVRRAYVLLYRRWRYVNGTRGLDTYVWTLLVDLYLDGPEPDAMDRGARPELMAVLAQLPRGQRAVLVLRYWEHLTIAETAEALRCSLDAVLAHTAAAAQALRRLMSEVPA